MFTIEKIHAAHAKVKTGADFPRYIKELKELGLKNYTNYVADGHTIYRGSDGYSQTGPAKYPEQVVKAQSSPEALKTAIKEHQAGKTDYLTVCRQAADAGVEKWIVDLDAMTCTYYDTAGNELMVEAIPNA
jgi:uncharacterized protein YbcV (DUF1398 family)